MTAHLPHSKSSLQQSTWLSALQVLDVINSAERALFEQQPELADAKVFVHLTSHVEVRQPAALAPAQQTLGHLLAAIKQLNTSVRRCAAIAMLWFLPCCSATP